MTDHHPPFPVSRSLAVRQALLDRAEIALIDVREEDPFAQQHPLWAANFPLSRIELDAWTRIPRRDTRIVVYGTHDGEDLAPRAAARLRALGYTDVSLLDGGLDAWIAAGGEVFRDVNVPSKSFGELVEARRHTPSLSAPEVQALIDSQADPASVFLYRGEARDVAQSLGIDVSPYQGPIVPVIYTINLRDPAGLFLASSFEMRNKDILYASNSLSVESTKFMNYLNNVNTTIQGPITTVTSAYGLRNIIRGTGAVPSTFITGGGTTVVGAPAP